MLNGTSIAVRPTLRITASGCHARVVSGVCGLIQAGIGPAGCVVVDRRTDRMITLPLSVNLG